MEARLHGPFGESELVCDLGDGELAPETECEQCLLVGGETGDRRPELGVGRDRSGVAGPGRRKVDDARSPGASAEFVAAER